MWARIRQTEMPCCVCLRRGLQFSAGAIEAMHGRVERRVYIGSLHFAKRYCRCSVSPSPIHSDYLEQIGPSQWLRWCPTGLPNNILDKPNVRKQRYAR